MKQIPARIPFAYRVVGKTLKQRRERNFTLVGAIDILLPEATADATITLGDDVTAAVLGRHVYVPLTSSFDRGIPLTVEVLSEDTSKTIAESEKGDWDTATMMSAWPAGMRDILNTGLDLGARRVELPAADFASVLWSNEDEMRVLAHRSAKGLALIDGVIHSSWYEPVRNVAGGTGYGYVDRRLPMRGIIGKSLSEPFLRYDRVSLPTCLEDVVFEAPDLASAADTVVATCHNLVSLHGDGRRIKRVEALFPDIAEAGRLLYQATAGLVSGDVGADAVSRVVEAHRNYCETARPLWEGKANEGLFLQSYLQKSQSALDWLGKVSACEFQLDEEDLEAIAWLD